MFIHTYDSIITFENIFNTWEHFVCGKRKKKDVMQFELQLSDKLFDLFTVLKNKTYTHSSYTSFHIADPKPRHIHKAIVKDRILHHLVYKELYPYFEARFIYDSYSCREYKGTHKAGLRFRKFAQKVSKNHTKTCFVLKCDIRKFFASIDHEILFQILEKHIQDKNVLWLLRQVVGSFYTTKEGVGLALGNLTSQLLVNIYMNEFDQYIKSELRVKYYIRYADDFVILSDSKMYLETVLQQIDLFLCIQLKLELHPTKVSIEKFSSGVDFLGWVHFETHKILRTTTKKRVLRNMKHFPKPETVSSYRGLLSHGNTYSIQKRVGLVN